MTCTETVVRKPAKYMGLVPASDVASYDDVSWYRKYEFALFPFFFPAIVVIAWTGDIYFEATDSMKKYSDANVWRFTTRCKVFFVAWSLLVVLAIAYAIFG